MGDRSNLLARRAAGFRAVREAHGIETAEDYVELIGDLIAETGEARLTDLALCMGVAQPTVAKVLARLKREGLVDNEPYRSLVLTARGRAMAERSRARHQLVVKFLKALGVGAETAEIDAEGLEHHASEETLAAFASFIGRSARR